MGRVFWGKLEKALIESDFQIHFSYGFKEKYL